MYNLQCCVCLHPSLFCFSTAVLLLFATSLNDELIVLLFVDSLTKTVGIAPVFNNTLTFPAPNNSASFLYG